MASEVTKRLRDRRMNVWEQCKELADTAANENRAFTAEEQGSWEVMNEEMETLDKRIKSALDAEKRAKDADDAFDAVIGKKPERRGGDGASHADSTGKDANEEIRAFLRGDRGAPRSLELRHNSEDLGPLNYRTLLSSTGSPTSIVPTDFYDRLIAHLIEVSGIMQAGPTVLNTEGGETLQIPKTTAHSTAALTGQGITLPTSDPAFSQATLAAYKYGIMLQVGRELIDDQGVDLIGYLAMQAGRAVGNAFGTDLVNGNGSSKPSGLIFATSASPGVTGATTGLGGAATYANLVDLEYSVIAPYRQSRSCYWMAADKTIGGFRKITDSQGRPIWEPSAVLGSPDLLLGKPVVADPFMPAVVTSAFSVAFGDFAQFFVRLVGGVRFERSDDFAFGSDLVTFRCLLRGDGSLIDTNGVKLYKGPAT
jgi:HK97 family phage major capsid protein